MAIRLFLVLLILPAAAGAADLFSVNAQTTSGAPQRVSASGNNITDLVTHLVQGENEFTSLGNKDVSATLRYAGLKNAVTITRSASGNSATVSIPSIGLTKTFTGANSGDVKDQIIDYVKKNGATEYAKFLRVVNRSTTAGVTDGNPLATTSMLSDYQYFTFGMQRTPFAIGEPNRLDANALPRIRFDVNGGFADTRDGNGYFVGGVLDLSTRLTDQISFVSATPFQYRNLHGASVYEVGEELALPIAIIPAKGDGFSWMLTPAGVVGAGGSLELAAGGTFAGGGITSSLSYRFGSITLTLANHYSYFRGFPIHFGDYHFNTNLEQQILKNGLKLTKSFGPAFFVDIGITYSNLLEHAAVRNYWTPSAGVGIRFGPAAGLRIGYAADLAPGFKANEGTATLYVNY